MLQGIALEVSSESCPQVVAHLMLEGVCSNVMMKQGVSLDQISTMTERVRFLKHNVGSCPGDLGHLLLSFLDRYAPE